MPQVNELVRAIHASIHEANDDHSKWTGDSGVQTYGVEGFLVARIAAGIMNLFHPPGYLTFETSFNELYDNFGKKPRGPKTSTTKGSNRIDIALYYKNKSISHVIEVKRFWNSACYNDLDRLCHMYLRYGKKLKKGPLKEAIFAMPVYTSARKSKIEQKLQNYFTKLHERAKEYVNKKHKLDIESLKGTVFCHPQILEDNSKDKAQAFSSLCLRVRP